MTKYFNNYDFVGGLNVVKRSTISILNCTLYLCLIVGFNLTLIWAQEQERSLEELLNQGSLYFSRGDCELAQYIFQEALKLEPSNTAAMLGKGRALSCQGALQLSIEEFEKIIVADPNNLGAYIQLAIAYLRQFNDDPTHYPEGLDKAFDTVIKAESIGAANPRVLNMKGVVLYHKKDFAGANLALGNALNFIDSADLSPAEISQIHVNLGRVNRALGNDQLALKSFRQGVMLNPLSFEAHNLVGEMYFLQENCEQALYELTQAANLASNSLAMISKLAIITFECGDPVAAEPWFKKALELDGGISLPILYTYLARVHLTQSRFDDAVREAQKGALLLTDNAEGFYWLGQAYQTKGEVEAAKDAYRQALEVEPNFIIANEALNNLP